MTLFINYKKTWEMTQEEEEQEFDRLVDEIEEMKLIDILLKEGEQKCQ